MKICNLILSSFIWLCTTMVFSQVSESISVEAEKKDSLKLSITSISENPARFNGNLFTENGYDYDYIKPVKIGTEISGSVYNFEYPALRSYGVSLAFYPGNSNTSDKRIRGLGELSKQYQLYFDKPSEYNRRDNYLYYAPGISIFSKNKKYSLDLFQSFSSDIFNNGSKNTSAYKLNFRF
jgi:hypothetical protein